MHEQFFDPLLNAAFRPGRMTLSKGGGFEGTGGPIESEGCAPLLFTAQSSQSGDVLRRKPETHESSIDSRNSAQQGG